MTTTTPTTTKRSLPTLEELRAWAALPNDELDARIEDMLSHAEDYERPVDVRSYRQGLEEGARAALVAWQLDRSDCDGAPVTVVYTVAHNLGLDGAQMVQRVADATHTVGATR